MGHGAWGKGQRAKGKGQIKNYELRNKLVDQ